MKVELLATTVFYGKKNLGGLVEVFEEFLILLEDLRAQEQEDPTCTFRNY